MLVRPYRADDSDAIGTILDATYGHDARLRALQEDAHGPPSETPFRRTFVAEVDDRTVAAATVSRGSGVYAWFDVAVAPDVRRRGIGTALFAELRAAAAPTPLLARVHYDQPGAIPFARRHGLRLVNRSWDARFDPAAIAPRVRVPAEPDEPPTPDEAAAFFARWYEDVHRWAGASPIAHERAHAMFCGDDVLPDSLVGVRDRGRVIAAANLIRPPGYDPGDEVYLVWIGAETEAAATTLLGACTRFALDARKLVHVEVDESNAPVHRALERIGVLGPPVLAFYARHADT